MNDTGQEHGSHSTFATTHWSVVLEAGQAESSEASQALEQLCQAYWYPLYAYVRRTGHAPHDAQDLVQAFFSRFLEKKYLQHADRKRGRFRTFLLSSLKNFLINDWVRQRYGELLRKEIVQTVATPAEVDDELRYLVSIIRNGT